MNGVRRAKQLIAEGAIGDVLFCRGVRNGWEGPQPQVVWKKQRAMSGGHLCHHIHEHDLIQSILGPHPHLPRQHHRRLRRDGRHSNA